MLASLMAGWSAALATETASEQAVRAAMLFNFLKFSERPAAASPRLQICVASSDPEQLAAMETLGDRRVRDKPLTVVRFRQQTDCDVIYVDSRQLWNGIADRQAARQALTLGSYPGFLADGGVIEIAFEDGTARFDINLSTAKRAGLRLYPQLLRLARRIVE